ncbi:MAG: hypothetical protein ABEH40_01600 [Haloferacaceae archaeon]
MPINYRDPDVKQPVVVTYDDDREEETYAAFSLKQGVYVFFRQPARDYEPVKTVPREHVRETRFG